MNLPHELFSAIYKHYPVMWDRLFFDERRQKEFWRAVQPSEHFRSLASTENEMGPPHALFWVPVPPCPPPPEPPQGPMGSTWALMGPSLWRNLQARL